MTEHELRVISALAGIRMATRAREDFIGELSRFALSNPRMVLSDKQKAWLNYSGWQYREEFPDEETGIICREICEHYTAIGLLRPSCQLRSRHPKVLDIRKSAQ